jgi:hypothetical protein
MDQNRELIARYLGQPPRLPAELRAALERAWGGQPVQLYALADLDRADHDRELRLGESWLALGPGHVALARRAGGTGGRCARWSARASARCARRRG